MLTKAESVMKHLCGSPCEGKMHSVNVKSDGCCDRCGEKVVEFHAEADRRSSGSPWSRVTYDGIPVFIDYSESIDAK